MSEKPCFGFFVLSDSACRQCGAAKRCKSILASSGFEIAAAVIEQMMAEIPAGATFYDTDKMSEMFMQIVTPGVSRGQVVHAPDDLLDALEKQGIKIS